MANFRYEKKLGKGSFGDVWLVEDLGTGALRALKFVSRSAIPNLEAYNQEAHVLNELRHPNIVEVYGTELFSEDDPGPGAGMYGIVMEYMPKGSLEDALKQAPLFVRTAMSHITEACRGAELAHSKGYVHRDVKPGNILLNDTHTKLSDFGLCAATAEGVASGAGTLVYVAPEVIATGLTTVQSDVYSLGATLYELVNGSSSLDWSGEDHELEQAILSGKFPVRSTYLPFVPDALRKIVSKALQIRPDKRYKAVGDFRIALQRVVVKCDWRLERTGDPEVWIGIGDRGVFQAARSLVNGSFELAHCKALPGRLRRITADCVYGLDPARLRKHQQVVMQRIVSSGR